MKVNDSIDMDSSALRSDYRKVSLSGFDVKSVQMYYSLLSIKDYLHRNSDGSRLHGKSASRGDKEQALMSMDGENNDPSSFIHNLFVKTPIFVS